MKSGVFKSAMTILCRLWGHNWKSRGFVGNLVVWECPRCKIKRTVYVPHGQFVIEN